MGAGQSFQRNLWSSTLQFQSKNNKLGIIRLTDKQTEDNYVCRKISLIDKKQIEQIDRLVDIKLSVQSPYIVKLQKATNQKNQQYCAYGKNYYLLFKQPYQTLKQQTLNRKFFKNSLYTETQLQMMLEVGVKALFFLKNIDHPHQNISSTAFFINENRSMILGDPFMFSRQHEPAKVRNGFIYPSPQLIRYQNQQIEWYNKHLSDLFSFGLVLLQVFYMRNMDCVFERYFERINFQLINKKLSVFKNLQLRRKLFILLSPEPKNRQMIYKFYVRSISASDVFNRLQKQKFKKTIDRYNLATSQVTEWKNDVNLEKKLSSSEGKKTFSVSTAQNPSNQDKNLMISQDKMFRQNAQFSYQTGNRTSSQKMLQTNGPYCGLRPSSDWPLNYNHSNNISYQGQHVHFVKPVQFISSAYNRYQVPQNNFIPQFQYQNLPTINNHSNINNNTFLTNIHSPINSLQITQNHNNKPIQTNNLSYIGQKPRFFFSSNINESKQNVNILSLDNKGFNFIDQKRLQNRLDAVLQNSLPFNSFSEQFSFNSLNQLSKNTVQIQNSTNQKSELIQTLLKQPNEQLKTSQNYNFKQIKPDQQIQPINYPVQNEEKTNESKNQIIENNETQKKDNQTPGKQKRKRSSFDYQKYHHLSTINQRSEMTQSFISETRERKSDILIEEDEQNNQILRDYRSQEDRVDNNSIGQNKIWSITYPSGTKYIGQVSNDKRNGLGTFFYIDGSKYHGNWFQNKMNGFGTLYYPNGKVAYEGEWKLDNFHGRGKVFNDEIQKFSGSYHYQNCSDIENYWLEYDGQLFEDRKQGQGILRLANGEYFEAEFKNDQINGYCKFHTLEGKVIEGVWENNRLVKVIQQRQKA